MQVKRSEIGEAVKAKCESLGITYAEAAKRAGLPLGTLKDIMRGSHKPYRQTGKALAKFLGVKPEEVMRMAESKKITITTR